MPRRGTVVRICGPADNGCWVYGTRVADQHTWEGRGQHRLCVRCGLPKATFEAEEADDVHHAETGHHLGTGTCADECGELS